MTDSKVDASRAQGRPSRWNPTGNARWRIHWLANEIFSNELLYPSAPCVEVAANLEQRAERVEAAAAIHQVRDAIP